MTGTNQDEILLERTRSGDQNAFLLLYERHRNRIFSFLIRLLGSAEIAESITHDCFMSVVRASEESRSSAASLRTRLYSCARAMAVQHLHDSSQGAKAVGEDHFISRRNMQNNERPKESLVSEIGEAVASLPPLEREALILAEYEGLELDEIANVVHVDVGIVNARLRAARQRLRKLLANHL